MKTLMFSQTFDFLRQTRSHIYEIGKIIDALSHIYEILRQNIDFWFMRFYC